MKPRLLISSLVTAALCAAPALAASDGQFVEAAMKNDNAEVVIGKIAEKVGSNERVRNLGTLLATDHAAAGKEMRLLARKIGIEQTDQMTPEAVEEVKKLNGLSGVSFDKEFVRYVIADHQRNIKAFKSKAGEGKGRVSTLADYTVPLLQKHLETAQKLAGE